MYKYLSAFVLFLCVCTAAVAQDSVAGYVTDENGEALIGVGVFVKGSGAGGGSITDTRGRYTIAVPDMKRDTLVFSYIGMETVEVPVRNRASVDVRMMPSANYLDDVVVIGYGTVRRSDLTGAISSVSSEKILRTPANNVAEALAGKLAGVQVLTTDGAPDAEISMYVRGRNSITQSNAPLYIVDGFPVSSISDIAASDIQSIDVLKDASSTAIYGSRGSNGVIMITTKSAHNNGITVSFNAYLGMKYVAKMPEVLEPYEYALWQYEQSVNRGITESMYDPYFGSFKDIGLYKDYKGNDWQDIVFGRSALIQNYNVALNGRTDKITWSASYTRQEDEAVMITSGYVRDNFTFKFQHRPNRKITLDFQTRYSNTQISGSGANEQNARSVSDLRMRYVMQYSPIPLNGLSAEGMDDDEFYSNSSLFTPTEFIRDNDRRQTDRNITFSGGLTWRIIDNLTFKSNVNYELRKREDKRFFGVTTYYSRMTSTIKDQPAAEMSVTDHNRIINYNSKPKHVILEFIRELAGSDDIYFDKAKALSEFDTSYTNRSLAYLIKSFGNIDNDIEEVLDVYCHQCSISMNVVELAKSSLFLANSGRNIYNGNQIISPTATKRINSLMLTCGLYNEAGEFAYRVGLPGKSGVGGGIVAILPGKLSIAVWSPELNKHGNSYRGISTLEAFATKLGISVF